MTIQELAAKVADEIGSAWAKAQEHVCERHVAAGCSLVGHVLVSEKHDDTSVFPSRPVLESWVAPVGHEMPKRYPLARQSLWEDGWRVEIVETPDRNKSP